MAKLLPAAFTPQFLSDTHLTAGWAEHANHWAIRPLKAISILFYSMTTFLFARSYLVYDVEMPCDSSQNSPCRDPSLGQQFFIDLKFDFKQVTAAWKTNMWVKKRCLKVPLHFYSDVHFAFKGRQIRGRRIWFPFFLIGCGCCCQHDNLFTVRYTYLIIL